MGLEERHHSREDHDMTDDEIETNDVRIKIGPNMIKVILAIAVLAAVLMGDSGAIPSF